MNQLNQGNNSNDPPNIPVKRKRGRPRKDRSLNRLEVSRVPPGFNIVNGNQSRQLVAVGDANDGIMGQAVTGVVEAAFDAGYLLTVRIGNSNTSLRGVVFKPGHYVPLSTENDVAPHAQMIRRNEIPFPMEKQTRARGRHARSRQRNEQHGQFFGAESGHLLNGSLAANTFSQTPDLVTSKGKHLSPVSSCAVPLVGSRGIVVPVILQPVNLANGVLPVNHVPPLPSQADLIAGSKYKQVQAVSSQMPPFQPQTSHQLTLGAVQNENGPFHQGAGEVLHKEEVKSGKQTGVTTPYEVSNRVKISSHSSEAHIDDLEAGKSSAEDSVQALEGDMDNSDGPLFVEPLQAIHSNIHNQSEAVPKPPENYRMGRMSELLQALQENMTENQARRVEIGQEKTFNSNTEA